LDVRTVFVAGAGQMGAGIAQVCAENGLDVFLYDVSTEALQRGLDTIRRYLGRNVEKGRMDAGAMEAALGRIRPVNDLEPAAGADVVIDAVGSLFAHALPLVRRQGQVLLFGMDATATAAVPQVEITRNELEVRGTYIADGTFPDAIRLIEARVLPLEKLVTHRVSLAELPAALDALRRREAIKVIVEP